MNITIFGADDDFGRSLILHALWRGHRVTVYSRKLMDLDLPDDQHLKLMEGYIFDQRGVNKALKGADAAISVLTASADPLDKSLTLGTTRIIAGMEKNNVTRLVLLGNGLLLEDENGHAFGADEDLPEGEKTKYGQLEVVVEKLTASSLNYLMVCPKTVVDGELNGFVWSTERVHPGAPTDAVRSGDLKDFLLKEAVKPTYVRTHVGLRSVEEETYKTLLAAAKEEE